MLFIFALYILAKNYIYLSYFTAPYYIRSILLVLYRSIFLFI